MKPTVIYIIDSSAIFSGKPLDFQQKIVTTSAIADEFQPGGRDYRTFQLLLEKGLIIQDPFFESIQSVKEYIKTIGEAKRLSVADISILALAIQFQKSVDSNPVIVTDDYSIQNIAIHLDISIKPMNQQGITKRFKWERRCQGCKQTITEDVDVCPICGSSIHHVVKKSLPLKKRK